ncbi:IS200/IS605 family element transposase accessory protein TnpB (plasmid) [Pontibacillus sp. ALD_SL1]|uniref:RNA-guided endonuclease InsQ/TnpB family protein n=1 Tax=Pontibacillus sp. ALD_SL1 TaxID=2777185 RepID=UPI001A96C06D|nr:RNA-guided endonuclease TnpB family protein [Pontibacillus sp. ALD_SL1]QST02381.1 IS200/IS605 family element transposase accessory protein TnpB [Pontibacillus sp. ALD_SL1]
MLKCHKMTFHANRTTIDRLFQCNRISGEIWNECVRLSKEFALINGGKWINQTNLQKAIKRRYPLHSQSIQAVAHKYLFSRDSTRKARKKGYKTKYPYKTKRHFNTKWAKDGFTIHPSGKIELSMGIWNRKQQPPLTIWIKDVPIGTIKEIELLYDRKLMVSLSYEDGAKEGKVSGSHEIAIDQGEIHSLAAVSTRNESVIITGRKIRSIKRLRNKKIGALQKKMAKCKKGSRQWKKYNRAKQYILSKSDAQLKDALHKTSRSFVSWAVEQEAKHVVVGDVEGVQRGTSARKKNKKKRRRKTTNQKLSQWQFGKVKKYLEYKLQAEGITLETIDESYTSQTCPVCGLRRKVSSRTYTCRCGYTEHRDIHGAKNILSKHLYGDIQDIGPVTLKKYLRIA